MSGPPPTPTAILEARGSWRAKIREGEPQSPCEAPDVPSYLNKRQVAIWDALVPQLEALHTLGSTDGNTIGRYCALLDLWQHVKARVEESGTVQTDPQTGKASNAPEFKQMLELSDRLLRLEQQFGLTPASRASLSTPKVNPLENRGRGRFFVARGATA